MQGTGHGPRNEAASTLGEGLRAWRARYPDLADCPVRNVLDRISGKWHTLLIARWPTGRFASANSSARCPTFRSAC